MNLRILISRYFVARFNASILRQDSYQYKIMPSSSVAAQHMHTLPCGRRLDSASGLPFIPDQLSPKI
jgi:hypothetical protein